MTLGDLIGLVKIMEVAPIVERIDFLRIIVGC